MDERYREGDHLLGIAGLALLRAGAQRRLDAVGRHAAEIETIARRLEEPAYARRPWPPSRAIRWDSATQMETPASTTPAIWRAGA